MSAVRTRVLVVEDSLTVRKYLVQVLSAADLEVVGEAEDGKMAIEMVDRLRPDVVTLDMMLPVLSGLAATEYIMAYCPTPILVVSASTNRGEVFKTYDALSAGAVDVFEKPAADRYDSGWDREFISKVRTVSRIRVITHPRAKLAKASRHAEPLASQMNLPPAAESCRCVAIGASTGGPGAVLQILAGLPKDFSLPILLVIHIGEPFGFALADWLDGLSPLRVRTAVNGQPLPTRGTPGVIMAPHDRHLILRGGRLELSSAPERHSCRPSVDVLFESVARELGPAGAACLLTGMGRDGAAGMLAVKRAGGVTLAQDEATSVIFGMPREAILLGAADCVVPVDAFAPALLALAGSSEPAERRA